MSEFSESHTVSKLLGSPAGYVGYREGARLTDAVRQRPHCVILLDEMEKAHRDVHNLLLQILDDGVATDATGRSVSFKNTVIIMTTNAGRERFFASGLGFGEAKHIGDEKFREDIRGLLEEHFKPELLNRIDHICLFRPLERPDFADIAAIALQELATRAAENGITLGIADDVAAHIATLVHPKYGARDVRRIIEEKIEHELSDMLLRQGRAPRRVSISIDPRGSFAFKEPRRAPLARLQRRKVRT